MGFFFNIYIFVDFVVLGFCYHLFVHLGLRVWWVFFYLRLQTRNCYLKKCNTHILLSALSLVTKEAEIELQQQAGSLHYALALEST